MTNNSVSCKDEVDRVFLLTLYGITVFLIILSSADRFCHNNKSPTIKLFLIAIFIGNVIVALTHSILKAFKLCECDSNLLIYKCIRSNFCFCIFFTK